ncbi:MAG: hypothetical protein H6837_14815 [Planctomycetes bacterium]|nr:hypothetical protein [Planctomycetota bacterium]
MLLRRATWRRTNWRVPQDAVDQAYDRFVDRWLADTAPADPVAWIVLVAENALRAGPARVGLRRGRCSSVSEQQALQVPDAELTTGLDLAMLRAFPPAELAVLTPGELCAFFAILDHPSLRAAAAAVGMSPRDLRARRRRVITKLRCVLAGMPVRRSKRGGPDPLAVVVA